VDTPPPSLAEVEALRRRLAAMEAAEARHREAEEALRAAKEYSDALIRLMPDGLAVLDSRGVHVDVNDAFCRMTGFSREELLGVGPPHPYWPPECGAMIDEAFQDTLAGRVMQFELVFMRKGGERFPVIVSPAVVRDASGRILRYFATVKDMTDYERAGKALEASEERYRLLAECTDDMIVIVDPHGTILYANSAAAAHVGVDPASLVGRRQEDLFPPQLVAAHLQRIRTVIETGEAFQEDEIVRNDTTERWLNVHLLPLRDDQGRASGVMVVSRDITDRKLREEQWHNASEEKYKTLVETSPDGVIMTDLEGHITYASRRLLEMHGTERVEDLVGRNPLDFIAPEDHQRFLVNLRRTVEEGVTKNIEYVFLTRDGSRMAGEVSAAAICDPSGKPVALVAILRDITDRHRAQQALQRERQTLEHLLQASDHERQVIAYDIHDGLAQQLAGAMMQFQVSEHLKETRPDEAAAAFQAGQTMLRQAHFEARRLISGVRPPILDESGLVAAVAHLVHEHQRQKKPKIQLHSNVKFARLPSILENGVYRIVQEGLANACKHSQSKRARVELVQQGDRLHVAVQDWGIGFDPQAPHRGHYGLEGIRQRARLLGGRATIQSAPGEGTRIAVELPLLLEPES